MLSEIKRCKQVHGEPARRWFTSKTMDLIIWFSSSKEIIGFQICYDIDSNEKALTWRLDEGFTHNKIDSGEGRPGKPKKSPILISDGNCDYDRVYKLFQASCKLLPKFIVNHIQNELSKANQRVKVDEGLHPRR